MARLTTKARETSFSSATIEVTGHHGVDNRPYSGSPRRNEMLRGCFEALPTAKTRASGWYGRSCPTPDQGVLHSTAPSEYRVRDSA